MAWMKRAEKKARKMSRAERRAFNEGYAAGYTKGLYDGNPFNKLVEACGNLAKNLSIVTNAKYSENVKEGTSIPIDEEDDENGKETT